MRKEKIIAALVIGCILSYVLSVLVLAHIKPEYNHFTDLVSELGRSGEPFNYVLNMVLILSGIGLMLMAWSISKLISTSKTSKYATISMGLFGVSVLCGGIFTCDSSCLAPTSYSGFLHAITGMPAVITAPTAFILFGRTFRSSPHFVSISAIVFWLGIASIFAMVASAVIFPYINLMGLGQRIAAIFQLTVPFIIAYKLFSYPI
ncbi:DUF998 domain-containing protein [Spongiimicrobium sp. 3-5]|uniref:DUF998 domain-containing protein n=1 Tax=Spongiimicrobium sp. 3-5 TaxID=3332596 RepID=UPI0039806E7C